MDKRKFSLITGATSGIGRELAISKSQMEPLLLHGRNRIALEETLSLCRGSGHLLWECDLEGRDVSSSLEQLIQSHSISIKSFIHCAGATSILPARRLSRSLGEKIMAVNCLSALEIISVLKTKNSNEKNLHNIIFISSIWSKFGAKGYTYYCASKAAIDGAMRALSVELAPDVRVNSILLGAISTKMSEGAFSDPDIKEKLLVDYPLGLGRKNDAVDLINFLGSNNARWMTGQQVVLDGGRTVNMSLK